MSDPESRILGFGIAGSVAVHLLAALMFACWVAFAPAPVPVRHPVDPPVEVILPENIELVAAPPAAPAPVKEPQPPKPKAKPSERYIRTTQNEEEAAAPKKADFISDRNTTAAAKSAADPKADTPLPTSKGAPVPTMELADRNYKDGQIKNDSAPSPPPLPQLPPVAQKKPEPEKLVEKKVTEPLPPPEKMAKKEDAPAEKMMKELDAALLKESADPPPPEIRKAVEPKAKPPDMKLPDEPAVPQTMPLPPPAPMPSKPEKDAFVPQTRVGAAKGSISNIGKNDAVNAAATPSGRYMRQVTSAIEKRWHYYRKMKADFVEPCELLLHFYVDKNGKPENIKIDYNKANAVVTDFSITSVLEAKIPPIPADLIEILDNGRFEIEYHIVIY